MTAEVDFKVKKSGTEIERMRRRMCQTHDFLYRHNLRQCMFSFSCMDIDGGAASQTGDTYSSRSPGPTSSLLGFRRFSIWCSVVSTVDNVVLSSQSVRVQFLKMRWYKAVDWSSTKPSVRLVTGESYPRAVLNTVASISRYETRESP
ncbi:hypothetical protein FSP39_024655 [Pinctada imbricata]|uniref:Uncharacterized protein n=1 Tax=Pinctada imbricata TaxID=66713 RepID=A0AA89C850_PINIB|nr:hypothetical protein FSP39_024655 [Pinctada imbricata]